jgi:NADPH-dependent curcumin reductase CurA
MAVALPNGVTFALATSYGSAKTVSAITNANPGVASSTAHGFTDGDYVEMTSGWSRLNNRIVRVDSPTTDAFNIEGIDTSSTVNYPVGTGTGSAREITGWTQISQIMELSTSGGEMQFTTYSFLEQDFESQLPTQSSPMTITMGIADDPSLPGYIAVKALADTRALVGLKATMPNGSVILYNGYVSFNETPTMTKNSVMVVNATFSLQGRPVRYAS